jgi:predicted nucleic acid-binding protein
MGEEFLIDTNSISDYLNKSLPDVGLDYLDSIIDNNPYISFINRIELLSRLVPENKYFQEFIEVCQIIDLNENIILKTISIRRSRKIQIPDAIIAATAIIYDLTLITHNIKDFKKIPNLKLLDPYLL